MSLATPVNGRPGRLGRLLPHDRLIRTAAPLVLNTGANSVLGLLFWVVAARRYDAAVVAQNLAVLSMMMTLSGVCQLNLGPGLAALLPRAGKDARRLLIAAYASVTAFTVVVLSLFTLVLLPRLGELSAVLHSTDRLVLFAVAVALYNVFALQDAALVALRWGHWVPLENTAFGLTKLLLLLGLAGASPDLGVFLSWVIPMSVLFPLVPGAIFLKGAGRLQDAERLPRRQTVRDVLLDYLGYLALISSSVFLPVIALELLDRREASAFAIAWLTCSTLDLLATNVGTALTVERAHGQESQALRRTAVRRVVPLVAVVSALAILVAPWVLSLYGDQYADDGVWTLRLLLLASVPRALAIVAIAEARAQRQIGFIVRLRAQNCLVILTAVFLLAPRLGGEGIALGWLAAQLGAGMVAARRLHRREGERT